MRRHRGYWTALGIVCLALLALGGTVYAAGRISGRSIKVGSLPGNRLVPGSVPANRLRPGAISGDRLAPGSVTGIQIDVATLGQVPSAVHAESADRAREAETARSALDAVDAETVNGHHAGCKPATRPFAGACWQTASSEAAVTAPAAAAACASQGGELPEALLLAAFSQQPGVALANGDEWTSDLTNASGEDAYAVFTVSVASKIDFAASTNPHKYRCVLPLVG
jgi:hypothetical protein